MRCLNLRTLSLLIGWLHLVYATTAIAGAIYFDYYAKQKLANTSKYDEFVQVETIVLVLYLLLNVSRVIISVCLIKGIMQNNRELMVPFVYGQCVILVMFVSLVIIDALYDLKNGKDEPYSFLDLVLDLSYASLTALFLWPVFKLFRQMEYPEEGNQTALVDDNNGTGV
ncbi:uncharacterized protein LOC105261496 [Musca domestica]|uniref:Uncharacterized protein LOC105261496 n=1 Tax=Musca domestica TaxID=7370 RepID=A0A9J7I7V4_MUSDO|nr:uncharacterized protein LOC105261496 [Musca domestica]